MIPFLDLAPMTAEVKAEVTANSFIVEASPPVRQFRPLLERFRETPYCGHCL